MFNKCLKENRKNNTTALSGTYGSDYRRYRASLEYILVDRGRR